MTMKVAILHDWLTGLRGGERCLEVFLALYPKADVFSLIHVPGSTSVQIDKQLAGTSWLQRLPGVHKYYRAMLPFFPSATRSLDLTGYDLVISISHAAVKNVRVPEGVPHLCYCLTPMRYVWDQARVYFGKLTPLLWPIIKALQAWDRAGSAGVTRFAAISSFVEARIRCFYGRKADVIYPPVDDYWSRLALPEGVGEAFLYAGALVPYKRADAVVKACTKAGLPLWVVGTGPEEERLRRLAGPSVKFLGKVSDAELRDYYRRARALVFPAKEDFGMIPIECMAAGRPVIALRSGAARETVRGVAPWVRPVGSKSLAALSLTGVFIRDVPQSLEDEVLKSLEYFVAHEGDFRPEDARSWAEKFSVRRFMQEWLALPELKKFQVAQAAQRGAGDQLEEAFRLHRKTQDEARGIGAVL
jgi:glycosyltransferase involved in cell wall biosynthesis